MKTRHHCSESQFHSSLKLLVVDYKLHLLDRSMGIEFLQRTSTRVSKSDWAITGHCNCCQQGNTQSEWWFQLHFESSKWNHTYRICWEKIVFWGFANVQERGPTSSSWCSSHCRPLPVVVAWVRRKCFQKETAEDQCCCSRSWKMGRRNKTTATIMCCSCRVLNCTQHLKWDSFISHRETLSDEQSFNPDFFIYNVKCFSNLENKVCTWCCCWHISQLLTKYLSSINKRVYNKLLRRVKHG